MFLVSLCRRGIVGSAVELRHLRYFVAVAEAENVLRAATRKLHVSQPAVSRQIRDLEDELGVQLFERSGKAISLTEAGRLFLKEAGAVLERTDEAVRNVRAFAQAGETELHVGYSLTPSAHILSSAARAFQRAMPNVHVKLHDWSNEEIAVGLRDGRLKVALVARALERGESLSLLTMVTGRAALPSGLRGVLVSFPPSKLSRLLKFVSKTETGSLSVSVFPSIHAFRMVRNPSLCCCRILEVIRRFSFDRWSIEERNASRGARRSVDRGACRPAIEPRNL